MADDGIYILKTTKDDGFEYRVSYLHGVNNYRYDRKKEQETDDPLVHAINARRMWLPRTLPIATYQEAHAKAEKIREEHPVNRRWHLSD